MIHICRQPEAHRPLGDVMKGEIRNASSKTSTNPNRLLVARAPDANNRQPSRAASAGIESLSIAGIPANLISVPDRQQHQRCSQHSP